MASSWMENPTGGYRLLLKHQLCPSFPVLLSTFQQNLSDEDLGVYSFRVAKRIYDITFDLVHVKDPLSSQIRRNLAHTIPGSSCLSVYFGQTDRQFDIRMKVRQSTVRWQDEKLTSSSSSLHSRPCVWCRQCLSCWEWFNQEKTGVFWDLERNTKVC